MRAVAWNRLEMKLIDFKWDVASHERGSPPKHLSDCIYRVL